MLAKAYLDTYKFPAIITNCSNNCGPYQFPEKLILLMINNDCQANHSMYMAMVRMSETGSMCRIIQREKMWYRNRADCSDVQHRWTQREEKSGDYLFNSFDIAGVAAGFEP
jgi:hypothetical protein